jgi:hypothetical protein
MRAENADRGLRIADRGIWINSVICCSVARQQQNADCGTRKSVDPNSAFRNPHSAFSAPA